MNDTVKPEPIHIISLGAGVQSSTMALMAMLGFILPLPLAAIFGDTQGEPESVYLWLSWLCGVEVKYKFDSNGFKVAYVEPGIYRNGTLGRIIPVHIISKGSLADSSLKMVESKVARRDGKSAGYLYSRTDIPFYTKDLDGKSGKIRQRGCTRDFKIHPLIAEARKLVGKATMREWRQKHLDALRQLSAWKKECAVVRREAKKEGIKKPILPTMPFAAWRECQCDPLAVQWIGISMDEMVRMKESRDAWIICRWPLIENKKSRRDCLEWMRKMHFPKPPRSACVYCPFHDNAEWRRLKAEEPTEFNRAVQFERDLQRVKGASGNIRSVPFLHRSLVPLSEVDFSTEEERGQLNMFNNECEGMCGV